MARAHWVAFACACACFANTLDCGLVWDDRAAIGWNPDDTPEEQQRQREAWVTIQRAHAVANGLPVLVANRVGHEPDPAGQLKGSLFWGHSFVAGPQGEFLAKAGESADVLVVDVDLGRSEDVRRWWPFLRDRRIDAYGDLVKRFRD